MVSNATGLRARFTGRKAGPELPVWLAEPRRSSGFPEEGALISIPGAEIQAPYARFEGDNIFICKAHLTMDLNARMDAGIWNPDEPRPTGGTDEFLLDFLFGEFEHCIPHNLDCGLAFSLLGYRAEPPDFLPILGETPVEGFMLAIGCGANGVNEAPAVGRDMAKFIATGEKSPLLEWLPLFRFSKDFTFTAKDLGRKRV